jgi:hypothetical protein
MTWWQWTLIAWPIVIILIVIAWARAFGNMNMEDE